MRRGDNDGQIVACPGDRAARTAHGGVRTKADQAGLHGELGERSAAADGPREPVAHQWRARGRRGDAPLGHTVVVETSTSIVYPVHIAIAQRRQSERVIVVDAFERRMHERLSKALTPQVGWIRASLT